MADRNITLVFGLVTVPCKMQVAKITTPPPAYLCKGGQPRSNVIGDGSTLCTPEHAPSPRKAPYVCETCGPITDNDLLLRGVKSGKTYTIIDREAAAEAKESYSGQYGDALNLVPHPAPDFLGVTGQGDSLHYLTPATAAAEGYYQLMVKLVAEHQELAFAGLYTPVSATALYHLTVRDGVLVLAKRTREQALKPLPSVGGDVNDGLYAMLEGALETFVEPYDPATYEDTYATTLADLIEAGETVSVGAEVSAIASTLVNDGDLMAALAALAPKRAKKATAKKEKVA